MDASSPNPRTAPIVIGVDIGSTTVKAVAMDPETKEILWSDYQRHQTRQPEMVIEFMVRIGNAFPNVPQEKIRVFMTGSGSGPLCEHVGAKFVQEVNSVTLAVETLHPDVGSVVELGGQDAKIIIFKTNEETGEKQALCSMNDKCASGTGATIDKCMIKVGLPPEEVAKLHFDDSKLHHVAAKCGVFAETDIVNLVKSGIPSNEIMCSLADAIVMQNLSVLTRGNTLKHRVLLLGGPNTYLPFLQECWRLRIPQTWKDRSYEYPKDMPIEELIFIPENAQYYAAYGAVVYGLHEDASVGAYTGIEGLKDYVQNGRKSRLGDKAGPPLAKSSKEIETFREEYKIPKFIPATFEKGQVVRAAIGLDGGSTSSKAVLVDEDHNILRKEYQLSKGNPIQDTKEILANLKASIESEGATLEVIGFGATGYAADVLQECLQSDVNIVETIAHMNSAVHFFGKEIDVICDIGGQDIKVIFLKDGEVKNFRLSNQCSAGNGMLLQAMADQFGVPVTEYADVAFQAELSPKFSYGCAVFLDTDRVNFQKEGYSKEELLSGLAQVLPKNVWQYVVQIPRLASLGQKFVLQGGTQYNLAAVKSQVDYIKDRVPGGEVFVHPHTGEAGAIGAAFEVLRVVKRRGFSTFIGIDAGINLQYESRNDESTVCHFCPNNCSRTFIDAERPDGSTSRYISGFSCEKGTVESKEAMIQLVSDRKKIMQEYPNLVDYEARKLYQHFYDSAPQPKEGTTVHDVEVKRTLFGGVKRIPITRGFQRSDPAKWKERKNIRIGIPKVLNIWSTAPFFRTYLESIGIQKRNVVFSDFTSEELWVEGGKYGSIDPCYPSKVSQAHIHNLLFHHHTDKKPLNYIFFPILTHVPQFLVNTMDNTSCPIVAGTPEVLKASFTKEIDFFGQRNITYLDPALSFAEPIMMRRELFRCFGELFGITEDENDHAVTEAFKALEMLDKDLEHKGKAILETVEEENRVAILMIGRPYHLDPGLNHGITEEFQVLGFPVLSIRSLPKDPKWLSKYFGTETHPLDLNDVWPENYSANSSQKVWAAKFAARHPHVAVLDLSSFKCGHDSPTYGIIDGIIGKAGAPYSALHDIDANKPGGSIKIRIKTYSHTLGLYQERLEDNARRKTQLVRKLDEKKLELIERKLALLGQIGKKDYTLEMERSALKTKLDQETQTSTEEIKPLQIAKGEVVARV